MYILLLYSGGVRAFGLDCGFTASSLTGCANKIHFVKLFIAKDLQRLLSYARHFCPRTKTSCGSGGNCRWTDQCSGTTKSGLCPGPDGFKCCLSGNPTIPTANCKAHVISAGIKIPNQFPGAVTVKTVPLKRFTQKMSALEAIAAIEGTKGNATSARNTSYYCFEEGEKMGI